MQVIFAGEDPALTTRQNFRGEKNMFDDKKPVDYMASINKARRKRNQNPYWKYIAAASGSGAAL